MHVRQDFTALFGENKLKSLCENYFKKPIELVTVSIIDPDNKNFVPRFNLKTQDNKKYKIETIAKNNKIEYFITEVKGI